MIGYRFLPPAEEEMIEGSRFYDTASPGFGTEFLDDIQRVIDTLREHPKLGRPAGHGMRRALLRRFPYSLFYAEAPGMILIVPVAHQRRRPGYWRERL